MWVARCGPGPHRCEFVFAGAGFRHFKRFEDGTGIILAAAQIIDFAAARSLVKLEHETGHVRGMDVVADLLALVAVKFCIRGLRGCILPDS